MKIKLITSDFSRHGIPEKISSKIRSMMVCDNGVIALEPESGNLIFFNLDSNPKYEDVNGYDCQVDEYHEQLFVDVKLHGIQSIRNGVMNFNEKCIPITNQIYRHNGCYYYN